MGRTVYIAHISLASLHVSSTPLEKGEQKPTEHIFGAKMVCMWMTLNIMFDAPNVGIRVIGPAVDGDRVTAEVFEPAWYDDLPEWLQYLPIQRSCD